MTKQNPKKIFYGLVIGITTPVSAMSFLMAIFTSTTSYFVLSAVASIVCYAYVILYLKLKDEEKKLILISKVCFVCLEPLTIEQQRLGFCAEHGART
jgi:hypothetical protein